MILLLFRLHCCSRTDLCHRTWDRRCTTTLLAYIDSSTLRSLATRSPLTTFSPVTQSILHTHLSSLVPGYLAYRAALLHLSMDVVAWVLSQASRQFGSLMHFCESHIAQRCSSIFSLRVVFVLAPCSYCSIWASRFSGYVLLSLGCRLLCPRSSRSWGGSNVRQCYPAPCRS